MCNTDVAPHKNTQRNRHIHCSVSQRNSLVKDNTLELGLEVADSVLLGDAVAGADGTGSVLPLGRAETRALEHDVEIHAVNARGGIVLDAEIDVLVDAETEVA